MLANYLTDKKDDGFALLDMEASEAVAKINADGFDFTIEELNEFAEMVKKAASAGDELDENSLDNVSGGAVVAAAAAAFVLVYYASRKRACKIIW